MFCMGGGLARGVFVQGFLSGGLCLGAFCLGGFCPRTTIHLSRKEHGIRIILIYGPQENDIEETVSSFYHDVSVQVEAAFLNGYSVILLGDFNAKLGSRTKTRILTVINHDRFTKPLFYSYI